MTDAKHPLVAVLENVHNLNNFLLNDYKNNEHNTVCFRWPTSVGAFKLKVIVWDNEAFEKAKSDNIKMMEGGIFELPLTDTTVAEAVNFIIGINKTLFKEPLLNAKAKDILHTAIYQDKGIDSGYVFYTLGDNVVEVSLGQLYLAP